MNQRNKGRLIIALLLSSAMFSTIYTGSAYYVAASISLLDGQLYWPNTAGGQFTPWPNLPSGIAGQMLTPLDQDDVMYYQFIIKPGALIYLTIILWLIVVWQVWRKRASVL